jgi:hypothetical protein
MSQEFGVFNDEGCIEREFYTRESADVAALRFLNAGDIHAYAAEMCPDHADEEQPRDTCEHCEEELADDDTDDDTDDDAAVTA